MSHAKVVLARKDGANVDNSREYGLQAHKDRNTGISQESCRNFTRLDDAPIPMRAFVFVLCFAIIMCIVWPILWKCSDVPTEEKVALPDLFMRLTSVEGFDPNISSAASPSFHLTLYADKVSRRYRACSGGGTSMLRVSYHGMILAWGQVPYFCVDGGQSGDNMVTVDAKAEAVVLREDVRNLVWSELQVVGKVEFDVEGEVADLGYVRSKAFLYKAKAAEE